MVDLFRLNAPNVIKKVILAVIYQLSEICARNIWFQILLTNEVVNVALTRSQGHLRAGLEPAALPSENSLSVWNEIIAVCSSLDSIFKSGPTTFSFRRGSNPRPYD